MTSREIILTARARNVPQKGSALSGTEPSSEKLPIKLPGEKEAVLRQWRQTGKYTKGESGIQNGYIAMREIVGTAQWETEEFPVSPGSEYLLTWDVKIYGDKFEFDEPADAIEKQRCNYLRYSNHYCWNYAVEFIGVKIYFLDKDMRIIEEMPRLMRTNGTWPWKTVNNQPPQEHEGWIKTWVTFKVPKQARYVKIAYVFSSKARTNGCFMVRNVALDERKEVLPVNAGELCLKVLDAETGKKIPARVTIWNKKGEYVIPDGYRYSYESGTGKYFYCTTGEMKMVLPAGEYSMLLSRGFDYIAEKREITVSAGAQREVSVPLRTGLSMFKRKWFAGDHHIHIGLHYCSDYPQMDYGDLMEMARAEGENYIVYGAAGHRELIDNFGKTFRVDKDSVFQVDMEITHHLYGHTALINVKALDSFYPTGPYAFPMPYDHVRFINRHGGFAMATHPAFGISGTDLKSIEQSALTEVKNFANSNLARTLPMTLLLGEPCGYDIITYESEATTMLYYMLLNMGWQIPVGGTTDTNVDQKQQTLGFWQTFVNAERLDFDAIAEAYRQGRTFATNGPLVLFTLNGKGLGQEVNLAHPGDLLKARIEAFSQWGINAVELVFNGRVVARMECEPADRVEVETAVKITESGWLACRVYGPAAPGIRSDIYPAGWKGGKQFAHTSPVYIKVAGREMKPRREAVMFFSQWIDELEKFIEKVFALVPEGKAEPGTIKPVPEPKFLKLGRTEYTKQEAQEIVKQRIAMCRTELEFKKKQIQSDM